MSSSKTCAACGMEGASFTGLGAVFHMSCCKCVDCGTFVATKSLFFPIEGQDGRQHPLCQRDYFRRLNSICARCDRALRGSYITACNKKFHVKHFTCSLCPTLFGPKDHYYEHEGDVYCHFHFSTRFAARCVGCNSTISKPFVDNRKMGGENWHPECYMINKSWNVKLKSRPPTTSLSTKGEAGEPAYLEEERRETPISLREKQDRMERQVYRIWTVLSGFEESSATCISEMLRQVTDRQYLDALRMAEKFILHVEVLFATIDDLEYHFARLHQKGIAHVHEARILCKKTAELFSLSSRTQETGSRWMGVTQELLASVNGLARYLKILIRIALIGAIKLEKKHNARGAMKSFLDKIHSLAVHGANPSVRRMMKDQNGEIIHPTPAGGNYGTQAVIYGFRSLAPENAGDSPFREGLSNPSSTHPFSDLCAKCNLPIEEECVRLGTYQRWHLSCVQCAQCGEVAGVPLPTELHASGRGTEKPGAKDQPPILPTARRPPVKVSMFMYDPESIREMPAFGELPTVILCTNHAHAGCRGGFKPVERLEQYAFLLNVAVHRLYLLLKKRGVIPLSPALGSTGYSSSSTESSDPYRQKAAMQTLVPDHLIHPPFARSDTEITIKDDGSPSSPGRRPSPVPANEEGITLANIPRLVVAAPAQGQQRPSVSAEGKAAGGFEETFRQETGWFEQEQIAARREQEGEPELREFEIVALHNGLEQVDLRKDDEVYRQQKVREDANSEEEARKEQEGGHHEQEGRGWDLEAEARGNERGRSEEATHRDAERSQTEQESKCFSSYKLSNILHRNWASKARTWATPRSSFNFSRTSSLSYPTVSQQHDDDNMMDWERRQEEIYQRQRDQFRREQERFELL